MSTTTEKALASLKPEVQALSDVLASDISFAKDGTPAVKEGLYEANLPSGLTPETVQAVKNYDTTFIAAGTNAIGQAAVAALKKNDSLQEVTATIGLHGKDTLSVVTERSHDYVNRIGGGEPTTVRKFGQTTVKIDLAGSSSSAGQLGLARRHIGASAAAAFGDKK